jgi:hypothetical protein
MNIQNEQEEWNDMKTQWQSTSMSEMWMTQKLRWSLRMRMLGSWIWLGLEILAFILVIVMGCVQAAMGHGGVAAVLIGLALIFAGSSVWARRLSLRGASGSLLELIELSIRRARRSVRMAWANYFMTAVSIAAVLALYLFDFGDATAAYHDGERLAVAMVIFALYAIGVGVYHAYARRRVQRFLALRSQFASRAEEG